MKKTLDFLFCTSTSNNGNQNKKKSGKLICFFYCSLWSDFSVSCFCYVVNRPRPLFAQPWFQFIQPLESQPLWWPSPLLALALLKRPFSHSGTYFCILMFFRTERKKNYVQKKNACFSSNYLSEACWKKPFSKSWKYDQFFLKNVYFQRILLHMHDTHFW